MQLLDSSYSRLACSTLICIYNSQEQRPFQPTTTTTTISPTSSIPSITNGLLHGQTLLNTAGGYRKRIRMPPTKRSSTTTTTTEPPLNDNEINNQVKLLRTRPTFRYTSTTSPSLVPNTTPITQSTVPFFRKRTRPAILSPTTTTTTTTSSVSTTNKPRMVVRRKLFRTSSTTVAPIPSTTQPKQQQQEGGGEKSKLECDSQKRCA